MKPVLCDDIHMVFSTVADFTKFRVVGCPFASVTIHFVSAHFHKHSPWKTNIGTSG